MSPIYDYFCQGCGKELEAIRSIENRDNVTCTVCAAKMTRNEVNQYTWYHGWKFLKSVVSHPAPNDSGYHAKWDKF